MATRKKSVKDIESQWWRIQRLIGESEKRNGRSDRLDARSARVDEAVRRYKGNLKQFRKSVDAAIKKGGDDGAESVNRAYNRKYSRSTYMGVG